MKMRKVFLSFLGVTGLLFTSCDQDSLIQPYIPGALTEEVAIQNSTHLQQLMNATYANFYNREDAVFTSIFTDEAGIGYANGGQGITDEYVFFVNPGSDAPNAIWITNYFALARANRVIAFADNITPADAADAQLIQRLKADALVIRAFAHLRIMAYFSPDLKNDSALAGILSNRIITTSETNLQRTTNGVFYQQIHSDLDAALAIYASVGPNPSITGIAKTYYASDVLAKALKARAYSYKGDYTNAEIWANDVINTSGISLANTTEYTRIFWTDNEAANTEVIFRLKRTPVQNGQGVNMHNGWCSVRPNAAGSPFYEVSRALFNKLNPSNIPSQSSPANGGWPLTGPIKDVRFRTLVAPSSTVAPNWDSSTINYLDADRLIIQKYGGVGSGTSTFASTAANGNSNDYKLVRLSEMYFIRAEARANANDLTGAAAALEAVLDARNAVDMPAPVFANATQAWAEILNQRRLEFCFEGYRYIDLKRLASLANFTALDRHPQDYSSNSTNYPGANPANLPMNSYKFALPIPTSETNTNNVITQNPGY